MSEIRYYLDENVNPVVAEQLRLWEIDTVSVRDMEQLGDDDRSHLARATELGRVLVTHDQDFLRLATENTNHAGIVFAPQYGATIGGWLRQLRKLHQSTTAEAMAGQVRFVSVS